MRRTRTVFWALALALAPAPAALQAHTVGEADGAGLVSEIGRAGGTPPLRTGFIGGQKPIEVPAPSTPALQPVPYPREAPSPSDVDSVLAAGVTRYLVVRYGSA